MKNNLCTNVAICKMYHDFSDKIVRDDNSSLHV